MVDLDLTPHKINFLPGMMFCKSISFSFTIFPISSDFIVFYVDLAARFMDNLTVATKTAKNDSDIMLKVQSASWKTSRTMNINKTEKLQVLLFMCAEELECDANTIKLM